MSFNSTIFFKELLTRSPQKLPAAAGAVPVGGVDASAVAADFELIVALFLKQLFGDFNAVDDGNDVLVGAAGFAARTKGFAPRLLA